MLGLAVFCKRRNIRSFDNLNLILTKSFWRMLQEHKHVAYRSWDFYENLVCESQRDCANVKSSYMLRFLQV